MTKTKDVKILFHTLIQLMYKNSADEADFIKPLNNIDDIVNYILKLKKVDRFMDLKDNKFCFLESSNKSIINQNTIIITGLFKSARNEFRPNIINRKTGEERRNPKTLADGDIEKTHVLIKIDKSSNEVYFFAEYNYTGVTVNTMVNYFKSFNKKLLEKKNAKLNYLLTYQTIARNDFLTELERLSSSKIAEVFFNKQLLGSNALNFSEKTISLKKDLKLIAVANTGESITEVAIDLFNKLKTAKSAISKVRIFGKDSENNDVVLDSDFTGKKEFIQVDLNSETGEVNTTQIFTKLKKLATDF